MRPNHFPPKVGEIRTNDTVSILNVLHSDGAIGDKVFTYHPLELSIGRISHHPFKPLSFLCFGNDMLGMTFEVVLTVFTNMCLMLLSSLDVS
jgi:hypothetical protein